MSMDAPLARIGEWWRRLESKLLRTNGFISLRTHTSPAQNRQKSLQLRTLASEPESTSVIGPQLWGGHRIIYSGLVAFGDGLDRKKTTTVP